MLKNKVALVTGASRGIGAATALLLGQNGCKVAVNYHSNSDAANKVVNQIKGSGGKAIAVQADARSSEAVEKMVQTTTDQLGPIDFLIVNAGMDVPLKPFTDLTYDEFSTKVTGEMACFFMPLHHALPGMVSRKSGVVIGISSTLSRYPSPGFSSHSAAKSAVDGLMKSLAMELGPHGIRVITVAPGLTETDATSNMPAEQKQTIAQMTPLQRVGQPEDVAGVILCAVSDNMSFVNGAYIPVSGGILMP